MAYYPPYPNIYQPGLYQQMGQPQNQMMMQAQPMPNQQQMPMPNQPMQQQQMQQASMQPAMQPPLQQGNGMIWVSGKDEADKWPVIPGNAVALWDSNLPVVYLRQADNTGKPSTTAYDLVERTDTPTQRPAPQIDMSRYITIDDAEEMIDRRVNDILAERLKRPSKAAKTKEDTE